MTLPHKINYRNLEAPTPTFSTLNAENKSKSPNQSFSESKQDIHMNLKSQFSKKYGPQNSAYHHKSMAQLDLRYGIEKLPANSYLS